MGVESTTGLYIDGLNASWPDGVTENVREGDDHIRVIKTALKNTFPNLDAAVTLSPTELNQAAVFPTGTKMLFAQATAPTDWTIDTAFDGRALFTKGTFNSSAKAGGETGGSDDPGIMNKVPSHTHGAGSYTAASGGAHTHSVAVDFNDSAGGGPDASNFRSNDSSPSFSGQTNSAGAHTHTISGTSATNGSAANWLPKYATVIVATRD